jgi:riboflavin transporter
MDNNIKKLVRSSFLLAVAIVFQIIGKSNPAISQLLVGSVVNAVLLIAAFSCGTFWGASVGILTPVLAWSFGQLPGPFGPFIPFIALGNAIYVICLSLLIDYKAWGKYAGYVLGSLLKYLFLSISVLKLVHVFGIKLPPLAVKMMTTPQLITALIGGAIALVLVEVLSRRKVFVR